MAQCAVEERGLRNLPTTAEALPVLQGDRVIELFERTGVLSPAELASRFDVYAEQYIQSIGVEAKLVVEMATTLIYPAAMAYLSSLAETISTRLARGVEIETGMMKIVAEEANALVCRRPASCRPRPRCTTSTASRRTCATAPTRCGR